MSIFNFIKKPIHLKQGLDTENFNYSATNGADIEISIQ